MAAPLGRLLILELNRGSAGSFELDDGSLNLQGFAKAGVSIDNQRERAGPREASRLLCQLGEREQADVWQAENSGRKSRPRQIHRLVAAALDKPGEERGRSAGNLNNGVSGEIAEVFAGRHSGAG